jgi:hypothetical protein
MQEVELTARSNAAKRKKRAANKEREEQACDPIWPISREPNNSTGSTGYGMALWECGVETRDDHDTHSTGKKPRLGVGRESERETM